MNDFWIRNQLANEQRCQGQSQRLTRFSPSLPLTVTAAGQSAVINQIVTFVYFAAAEDSYHQVGSPCNSCNPTHAKRQAFNISVCQLQAAILQAATICNGECMTLVVQQQAP